MRFLPLLVLLLLSCLAPTLLAKEYAWVIGGGWRPKDSQVQIEHNIARVSQLIKGLPGEHEVAVYFTNGNDPDPDVKLNLLPGREPDPMEPLARVFGSRLYHQSRFRKNRLGELQGSTRPEELKAALRRGLAVPRAGDRIFIYYNGHGLPDPGRNHHPLKLIDPTRNYLRLWGNTRLDVREFEELLAEVDPQVPVRFVFTQCLSGGFTRLIHLGAEAGAGLAPGARCGLTAVSPWNKSEGCTASIESDDYRDYTRYLHEALTAAGAQRDAIDLDDDGVVGLYEAHIHTLRNAVSTDVPRYKRVLPRPVAALVPALAGSG